MESRLIFSKAKRGSPLFDSFLLRCTGIGRYLVLARVGVQTPYLEPEPRVAEAWSAPERAYPPTRLATHSSRLASRHDPALVGAPQLPVLSHLRPALHLHVHVPQVATALNVSRKEARVRVATTAPPASGTPRHQLSTRAGRLFSLVYKGAVIGAQLRRARSCTHPHPTPPRGVGTRLSPWVSASCLLMVAWTLFF